MKLQIFYGNKVNNVNLYISYSKFAVVHPELRQDHGGWPGESPPDADVAEPVHFRDYFHICLQAGPPEPPVQLRHCGGHVRVGGQPGAPVHGQLRFQADDRVFTVLT